MKWRSEFDPSVNMPTHRFQMWPDNLWSRNSKKQWRIPCEWWTNCFTTTRLWANCIEIFSNWLVRLLTQEPLPWWPEQPYKWNIVVNPQIVGFQVSVQSFQLPNEPLPACQHLCIGAENLSDTVCWGERLSLASSVWTHPRPHCSLMMTISFSKCRNKKEFVKDRIYSTSYPNKRASSREMAFILWPLTSIESPTLYPSWCSSSVEMATGADGLSVGWWQEGQWVPPWPQPRMPFPSNRCV